MRFFSILLTAAFLAFPLCQVSAESRKLVSYDSESISLEELKHYIQIVESPLDRLDLDADFFDSEDVQAATQIQTALEMMIFYEEVFERHGEEIKSDPEMAAQLHARLGEYLLGEMRRKIMAEASISDEQVQEYYEANPDHYTLPEERQLAIIYRASSSDKDWNENQRAVLEGLLEKEDLAEEFAEYARQYSQSPSAERGGELNPVRREVINPALDEPAFSLEEGEVSKVLETSKGYFLVKVLDIKTTGTTPLEAAAPAIRIVLRRSEMQRLSEQFVENLKEKHGFEMTGPLEMEAPQKTVLKLGGGEWSQSQLEAAYPSFEAWRGMPEVWRRQLELKAPALLAPLDYQENPRWKDEIEDWKMDMVREVRGSMIFLGNRFEEKAAELNLEKRAREYFEEHREFYHTPAPKELELLIYVPEPTEDENLRRVAWEKSRRAVQKLDEFKNSGAEPTWEELVAKARETSPRFQRVNAGFFEAFPEDWNVDREFSSLYEGYISKPIRTAEGHALYHVKSFGDYELLSWEDAREKAMSVVETLAFRDFREEKKKELLKSTELKFHFATKAE